MKKNIIALFSGIMVLTLAGCGGSADAAAVDAGPVEEASEEFEIPDELTDVDDSDSPADFLQLQSGVVRFKDYDEVISYLEPGQGYAYLQAYDSEDMALAIAENVSPEDKTAGQISVYGMRNGEPFFRGVVTGKDPGYPVRYADGIIYAGDDHLIDTVYMVVEDHDMSIMQKDFISDGKYDGSNGFHGFTRTGPVFDNDEDFTGGQEEFDAFTAEREKIPVVTFTIVGNGTE